jgi:hypothetical protein
VGGLNRPPQEEKGDIKMKKFWIDYQASIVIEAENEEDAKATFYQTYNDETRQFLQVDSVEEAKEEDF